jgi:hypothetical protein
MAMEVAWNSVPRYWDTRALRTAINTVYPPRVQWRIAEISVKRKNHRVGNKCTYY